MDNPIVIGIVSWFVPGAGHFFQKKWRRGLAIASVIWVMFVIAIFGGGAYYPGFDFKDGTLLYLLNIFARCGNGVGALISYGIASAPSPNVASLATFEYAGRFLETAGLLNYLAMLDAVDIALGRKK